MINELLYCLPVRYSEIKKNLSTIETKNTQKSFYSLLAKYELSDKLLAEHPDQSEELLWTLLTIGESFNDQGLFLSMGANFFAAASAIKHYSGLKILPDLLNGKTILAFAATENSAGSDVMAMSSTYKDLGDHYLLSGEKSYITNALTADYFIIFASKNNKLYDRGLSAFLLPKKIEGLSITKHQNSNLLINSGLGSLKMENIKLPKEYLLGKELQGAKIFQYSIKRERALILIPHIGMMKNWFEFCLQYVKQRRQFGKTIINYQSVMNKIYEIYKQVKIAYLLAKDITTFKEPISPIDSSFTKVTLSESLYSAHENTLKILGAFGLTDNCESPSNNIMDSLSAQIYSGTSDIQKNIIIDHFIRD